MCHRKSWPTEAPPLLDPARPATPRTGRTRWAALVRSVQHVAPSGRTDPWIQCLIQDKEYVVADEPIRLQLPGCARVEPIHRGERIEPCASNDARCPADDQPAALRIGRNVDEGELVGRGEIRVTPAIESETDFDLLAPDQLGAAARDAAFEDSDKCVAPFIRRRIPRLDSSRIAGWLRAALRSEQEQYRKPRQPHSFVTHLRQRADALQQRRLVAGGADACIDSRMNRGSSQ